MSSVLKTLFLNKINGGYMRKKYIEIIIMLWPLWMSIIGIISAVIVVNARVLFGW